MCAGAIMNSSMFMGIVIRSMPRRLNPADGRAFLLSIVAVVVDAILKMIIRVT
jgi:hypothetical protein